MGRPGVLTMNAITISVYAEARFLEGWVSVGHAMTLRPKVLLISRMRLLISGYASSAMPPTQDVPPFPSPPEIAIRRTLMPVLALMTPDKNVRVMAGHAWLVMHVLCIAGTRR